VAIPLLAYKPSSQNQRVASLDVAGDESARIYSTENILSATDLDDLIEAGYRQFFFHAFASDRERFLESQLRSGQNYSARLCAWSAVVGYLQAQLLQSE
jgi:phycobilisome rod-core linker protein